LPRPNFRQGGGQSNPAKEGVEKCEGSGLIIPVRSSAKRPDPEKSKETRGQGNPAKAGRAAYSAEVLSIFDRTKAGSPTPTQRKKSLDKKFFCGYYKLIL